MLAEDDRIVSVNADKIIFPNYSTERNKCIRVSEQEARFAFVESFCRYDSDYSYSVETPTRMKYKFTGKTPLSAQTDLTIHSSDGSRLVGVEFKAGGVSPKAKDRSNVTKDIEKLIREPGHGMWFHLLESTNNRTITDLFDIFGKDLAKLINKYGIANNNKILTFHICVLKQGFSIHNEINIKAGESGDEQLDSFFKVGYKVNRNKLLLGSLDLNNWALNWRGR
jgi:hypothetical protein